MAEQLPLTDAELDELERLDKAATPGPWVVVHVHGCPLGVGLHRSKTKCGFQVFEMIGNAINKQTRERDLAACEARAALIADGRNALPRLLAEVRAGREAGELIESAFRHLAHAIADDWLDTLSLSTTQELGEWLVAHAGWERKPGKAPGRQQWYRPGKEA